MYFSRISRRVRSGLRFSPVVLYYFIFILFCVIFLYFIYSPAVSFEKTVVRTNESERKNGIKIKIE